MECVILLIVIVVAVTIFLAKHYEMALEGDNEILSTALHRIRDTTIDLDSLGIAEGALRKVGEIE